MVKPGGTGSPALVISATPAPLPPSRSRILALPSEKRYTHFRGDCFTASSRVMSVVCATGLSSSGVLELPAHARRLRATAGKCCSGFTGGSWCAAGRRGMPKTAAQTLPLYQARVGIAGDERYGVAGRALGALRYRRSAVSVSFHLFTQRGSSGK